MQQIFITILDSPAGIKIEEKSPDLLGMGALAALFVVLLATPTFFLVMILANLDPPRSIVILLQLNINVAWKPWILIPRIYFNFYIYLVALRWLIFVGTQLLMALTIGVLYLQNLNDFQIEHQRIDLKMKMPILEFHSAEILVYCHKTIVLTCNFWSFKFGKLIASLLVGAAFFWGLSDYFIVKHSHTLPFTTYFVILFCSLAIKIMYVLLISFVSNVNTKSVVVIISTKFSTYYSKYLRRLLLAERSARISVPCFYFNKDNKMQLYEIPVTQIGVNFMLTF